MANKLDSITFRIEEDTKIKFDEICRENYTTISQKLYAFVHQTVKHSGKRINLSEYRERKLNN